jgi:hypothetical protein
MIVVEWPTAKPDNGDRSSRLEVVGALQILLGCFCGLLALFGVALTFLPTWAQPRTGGPLVFAREAAFWVPLAAAFIWLGKGMMAARRWAWTLTVVTSWLWLLFGAIAFISVVFVVGPPMWEYSAQHSKMPGQTVGAIRLVSGVFLTCLYFGPPTILLLLSHHESVRATCIRRDPRIPWTDRCPMPVLALSLVLAVSIHAMLLSASLGFEVPLFGTFVSGFAGAIVVALIAIILACLAWGTYRLEMTAWWGALLFGIAAAASTAVTFAWADPAEMYKQQGFSVERLETFRKMGLLEATAKWEQWKALAEGAAWVVYLLAVRRYFLKSHGFTAPEVHSMT